MNNQQAWPSGGIVWALTALLALWTQTTVVHATSVPTSAPDHSLTLKDYLAAGVPPIDKPWTPEDYQKAVKVLEEIGSRDATQLPRLNGKASRDLFAHMIAQENLYYFADKDVPVETRMKLMDAAPAYLQLFVLYIHSLTTEQTLDGEILELGRFILRLELVDAALLDEFIAAHPEKQKNPRTMAQRNQARDSIAQTAKGLVELMMDRAFVRTSEATRFARELKDLLPKSVADALPEVKANLREQLTQGAAKEQDKELKDALTELAAALK